MDVMDVMDDVEVDVVETEDEEETLIFYETFFLKNGNFLKEEKQIKKISNLKKQLNN